MKKNIFYTFIFVLLMLSTSNVLAANICSNTKYDELKKKASEIEAKWELQFDENHNAYFTVSFENVDENLMLSFSGTYYEPKDGKITLNNYLEGGTTYNFKFVGGYDHPCVEEYVYNKALKVPKYNKYSEMEECKENSEWELCDKWYDGEIINENDFREKLDKYLGSDEKKEYEKQEKENENKEQLIIIIVVVVVVIAIISVIVYLRKVKKINKRNKKNNNETQNSIATNNKK